MTAIAKTGPYHDLPATARRLGRGGHAFAQDGFGDHINAGDFLGTITAVQWTTSAEQIQILVPGQWRNYQVPGIETRSGTIRYQDVDDFYRMMVYNFFQARDAGDFSAQPPAFSVKTSLIGGPAVSAWVLEGCRIYGFEGGYANADDLMERELAFTYDRERPASVFQYTGEANGVPTYADVTPSS